MLFFLNHAKLVEDMSEHLMKFQYQRMWSRLNELGLDKESSIAEFEESVEEEYGSLESFMQGLFKPGEVEASELLQYLADNVDDFELDNYISEEE